jgi:formate/nitrite transporter
LNNQYENLLNNCKNKVSNKFIITLSLSIMAGIFISIGAIANLISQSLFQGSVGKLIGSILFSIGLILIFVANGELFTGNNLMIDGVVAKTIAIKSMIKNWFIVYIGNFIGCFISVILIYFSKIFNTVTIYNVYKLIILKDSKSFIVLFTLGILCNILVCLAVWMNYSSTNIIDKILIPILPITVFVFCGFEHSIADMFYLLINSFYNLSLSTFNILIPVTLGNIIGGMFIGLMYYIINNKLNDKGEM